MGSTSGSGRSWTARLGRRRAAHRPAAAARSAAGTPMANADAARVSAGLRREMVALAVAEHGARGRGADADRRDHYTADMGRHPVRPAIRASKGPSRGSTTDVRKLFLDPRQAQVMTIKARLQALLDRGRRPG